ncbi:MAG: outer membrane protein transport protein [Alphaproteobacteria bacterium]|nr:outer membrane protein transport protein [Alphaproteobacteria bacterium]
MSLSVSLICPAALASPADIVGFGAAQIGRGGGGVALPGDGGSAMLNPAGLSSHEGSNFLVGYSALRFRFDDLPPLYWDVNRDGLVTEDEGAIQLDMGTEYDPADGMMLGVARDFAGKVTLGASMFVPSGRLLRLKTFDPSVPTYFMHQNRAHRYAVAVALAGEPVRGLHVGGGVRVVSHSVLTVNLTLDATVAGEPDDESSSASDLVAASGEVHDLTFDLIPDVIPIAGIRWDVGELVEPLEGLAFGAAFRGEGAIPVDVAIDGQVNTRAEDVGDLEPVVAAIVAKAQLHIFDHFVPMQLRAGAAYTWQEKVGGYVDLEYTRWSRMNPSVSQLGEVTLNATLADLSNIPFTDTNDTSAVLFEDTVGFKAGVQATLGDFELPGPLKSGRANLRAGFAYIPSPLVSQGPDTALLDADRLGFSGGLGIEHAPLWDLIPGPHAWDLFFQHQLLASGQLERPTPDEPRAGYAVDGAPIPIGGGLTAAGMQWSIVY